MEEKGQLIGVVTQNIDGLHQKAGSKNVQEIHGTIWRNYCVSCGAEYDENYIFDSKDKIPVCEKCGKMVRPNDIIMEKNMRLFVAIELSEEMKKAAVRFYTHLSRTVSKENIHLYRTCI